MITVDLGVERLYSRDELLELRRYVLRYARDVSSGVRTQSALACRHLPSRTVQE
jgi:hypothetical protein